MKNPRSRDRWAWLMGGGLAVGLAACAPAGSPTPAAAPAPPGAAAGQTAPAAFIGPRDGGILRDTPWSPPTSFDYCKHADAFGVVAWVPIYEGLLSYNYKEGEDFRQDRPLVPFLAESWQQVDETTYTFSLRPNVKWHDGQPLTVDDVIFSLNYLRDPENACFKRGLLQGVKSIDKVDATKVRITTDMPFAPFLENMAEREAVIYPKHIFDAGKLFKAADGQIGSGPMKLKSFDRNSRIVYTANKDYWRGKPHVDGLIGTYGTDRQLRFAAFVGKETDILTMSDSKEFGAAMAAVPDAKGEGFPTTHGYAMYIRQDKTPLDDVRVRRAIHLALDRQTMEATLAQGSGRINPPGVSAVNAWAMPQDELLKLPGYRQPKDQDLAEARRLLREAGHPDGFTSSIQAVAQWTNPRIAEVAAQQLQKVGIDLKLDFIDQGVYFSNQRQGKFDIGLNGMSADTIDGSLYQYYYSKAGPNPGAIADPDLDRMIEAQRAALQKETRYRILRQIQQYLMDKMYVVPTVELGFQWAWHPYLHQIVNSRSTGVMLFRAGDLWLDERAPQRTLP